MGTNISPERMNELLRRRGQLLPQDMAAFQSSFDATANEPIPGLTGPVSNGGGPAFQPATPPPANGTFAGAAQNIVGSYNQQQAAPLENAPLPGGAGQMGGMPPPQSFAAPFRANGPYGLLAQQLAGVGPQGLPGGGMQIPEQQIPPMQSQGLLGGPKRGFRIPGGPGGK